ncbi:MAG: hypothetical protein JWM95_1191 [Gemmatimonadetes bacterium]|nr:hypothetical protein [Gemmatimonadota bacterium]
MTSPLETQPHLGEPAGFGAMLRRLGSESLVYGLSSIVGRLLSYLLQPYYAHQFDPAQNGVQSVVYSYIPIISIALYLGMDVAYMRTAAGVKDAPLADRQRAFSMSFVMVLLLHLLNEAGLSPYRVLAAATRDAARCLGGDSEFGTVSVGKRADVVLLDRNPPADLSVLQTPVGVVVRGRWLPAWRLKQLARSR